MNISIESGARNGPSGVSVFSIDELATLSALVRKGVFEICLAAEHGHIGGSSSTVELLIALYFGGVLRFNPCDPDDAQRDMVLVRGHLGPARYKIFSLLGWIEEHELVTYRRLGSRLCGHEDHLKTPGVDITPSGSLGMLLSYGVGTALNARDNDSNARMFIFLGDGEEQEGMVSEAARHAAHLRLGNLIAVIDRNGKQLSNPVVDIDSADLAMMWSGYGWRVISLTDAHDIVSILNAYHEAIDGGSDRPTLIIADTRKGIGLDGADEHFSGYHTLSRVSHDTVQKGIAAIEGTLKTGEVSIVLSKLQDLKESSPHLARLREWRSVDISIAPKTDTPNHPDDCQFEYFKQLGVLVDAGVLDPKDLYFLTADVTVKSAVKSLKLDRLFHFHNVGIREQHMFAMAHGLSVVRPSARILINSFDAFTYRGIDQINAALQGEGHMTIIGDVSGITNARNGRTHQSTGLPAALIAMDGLMFLEPWDAEDTFACLNWALGYGRRVVYIRVHSSLVCHAPEEPHRRTLTYYPVFGMNHHPDIVLVGSGLTVDSCIETAQKLAASGIRARVVNVVNPNALDDGFCALVPNGSSVLTAYNGDARVLRLLVADTLLSHGICPRALGSVGYATGNTGTLAELLRWTGLDGEGVYASAMRLLE